MSRFTRFGGKNKIWLMGRYARQQLDSLGLEFRRITGTAKKLGFAVDGFKTSAGDAMVVTHFGLDNANAGDGVIIDPAHCRIAQLRKMKHNRNIQTNNLDGELHEFLGELGLWPDQEQAHGRLLNMTTKVI